MISGSSVLSCARAPGPDAAKVVEMTATEAAICLMARPLRVLMVSFTASPPAVFRRQKPVRHSSSGLEGHDPGRGHSWHAGTGHDTKPRRITTTERGRIHSSLTRTPHVKRVTADKAGLLARGSMPVTAFPNLFPGPVAIVVPAHRIQLRGQPRLDA